jgi:dolichol-phosphate mannosyltransferase
LCLFIGGVSAVVNFFAFLGLFRAGVYVWVSAPIAYVTAALVNYLLCIALLFGHRARWNSVAELLFFLSIVFLLGILDLCMTQSLLNLGYAPGASKALASDAGLVFNFIGRRYLTFPEPPSGPWQPQSPKSEEKQALQIEKENRQA